MHVCRAVETERKEVNSQGPGYLEACNQLRFFLNKKNYISIKQISGFSYIIFGLQCSEIIKTIIMVKVVISMHALFYYR